MKQTITIKEAADVYIVPISRWFHVGPPFLYAMNPRNRRIPGVLA